MLWGVLLYIAFYSGGAERCIRTYEIAVRTVLVFIIVSGPLGFCYRAVKINVTGIIQLEAVGYNIISRSGLVADALQL